MRTAAPAAPRTAAIALVVLTAVGCGRTPLRRAFDTGDDLSDADTGVPDTVPPDTGRLDTSVPDSGPPDVGDTEVDPSIDTRPPVEICTNGVDDDGDNLLDCDDPDCAGTPECVRPEECGNGIDEDGDGLFDCADPDCFDDPACVDDGCDLPFIDAVVGQGVVRGDTGEGTNRTGGSCGGFNAPEMGYTWRAPSNGEYRIDTIGSDFDTILYVRTGTCGGREINCHDDIDPDVNDASSLVIRAIRGRSYVIYIDGFGPAFGHFVLNIERL